MKLPLFSHYFAPSIGGVETIVESLARGLADRRTAVGRPEFNVALVTQTPARDFNDAALPFRTIRHPGLLDLLRQIRAADVVHIAGPALAPMILALLARKPVVVEHHGFQTICPNGQMFYEPDQSPCPGHFMAGRYIECLRCNAGRGIVTSAKLWLLTFVRRFLSKRAARNVAATHWLATLLQLPKAETIPHGLDTSRALPPPEPPAGPPIIMFQGRLVTTKGARVLFEAARKLREQAMLFELHVIGDGPERESLERLAAEWNLSSRIHFLGFLPPAELDAALARASVVVIPSLGGEVFGLVVAENMLRGLPVVASDLGAFTEVLGDAGMTFRTGDAGDLAQRLAALLRDPPLAAGLGVRARQRALAFFARNRMIDAHARVYHRLCREADR